MQVFPVQMTNYRNVQPQFTGATRAASKVVEEANKKITPNLLQKLAIKYDQMTDWIAQKYFIKFYGSKFAEKFAEKTSKVNNMTTHMAALGATLISGMYIIRTLQNDKLDKQKRKTLAINDALTWGLSTAGSYFLDNKLGSWWEGVTTKFAANYLNKHPEAMNKKLLGEWNAKNLYEMIDKAPEIALDNYKKNKTNMTPAAFEEWLKSVKFKEKHFVQLEEQLKNGIRPKNILDLNLDILRNENLTTMVKGMGVLKTLFIFGMVYRYVVPVLVMKPANKIGAYIHKKNAEKAQNKVVA